jgi:hypothetical protein
LNGATIHFFAPPFGLIIHLPRFIDIFKRGQIISFLVDKGDTMAYIIAIKKFAQDRMSLMPPSLLTVEEVADLLKISPRALYKALFLTMSER